MRRNLHWALPRRADTFANTVDVDSVPCSILKTVRKGWGCCLGTLFSWGLNAMLISITLLTTPFPGLMFGAALRIRILEHGGKEIYQPQFDCRQNLLLRERHNPSVQQSAQAPGRERKIKLESTAFARATADVTLAVFMEVLNSVFCNSLPNITDGTLFCLQTGNSNGKDRTK